MSNKGTSGGGYRKKKVPSTSGHTKFRKSSGLKKATKRTRKGY